jgi:hypothetical protein
MSPLNKLDRQEGRKAMEALLTAAGRVRRQLKAGRPRKIRNVVLSTFDALHRLVNEAENARTRMVGAGLDPNDIKLALVYCTPEKPGFEGAVAYKWLPQPGETMEFFARFESEATETPLLYLGILWRQMDHESAGAKALRKPEPVVWVTQFVAGPKAEEMLFAARDHFITGGSKAHDN